MVETKGGEESQKPTAGEGLLGAIFGKEIFDRSSEQKPKNYTPDEVDKIRAIITNALTFTDEDYLSATRQHRPLFKRLAQIVDRVNPLK